MKSLAVIAFVGALAAVRPAAGADPQPATTGPQAWSGCCGLTPWPAPRPLATRRPSTGSGLFSGYANIVTGSALRHRIALSGGIPAPYAHLRNPLPATPANAERGRAIYDAECASCHGETGLADAPRSRMLKPPPAELGWVANLPQRRWDSFMYWSVADGGERFQTDMPSFKGKLTDEQIWSVIGYIQARLPPAKAAAR